MNDDTQDDYRAAATWPDGRPPAPARWAAAYAVTVAALLLVIALLLATTT
ncbi:hypothetical protein GCM10009639_54100 [Kitasatospora putterlickiae]|uniref:Uncharacterized protein n=1 Tax=Kitasatospora putterlickiae TaxID=221725 RepID=A0ABN1YEE0_9ACTN